ncbi:response regulator transcription factor [Pedobacter frigiditerrae]|uniref:Response regulator transcription factor n=1 Tax=Pedobacter frigiditerrae TaxID=2530452 RepID=A0A4R0MMN7_9SPHI|nr:response regulator transcription factor [Pedobacter frigiditerrae]TCC87998.1 response regulator transcription factor [Pedobacter frigiditerrae]
MADLKIFIADDHQILIDGIISFFNELDSFEVIGYANDGINLLRDIAVKTPDIILLDLNMPKLDGISTLKKLKESYPNIKVIILSNYHQSQLIKETKSLGASGYVLKNGSKSDLLTAIETAQSGKLYFPEAEEVNLNTQLVFTDEFMKKHQLTKREVEIIRLVCEELSSKEIGDKLFIAEFTVTTHRRNILSKLGLKNTPGLINFAKQNGIA